MAEIFDLVLTVKPGAYTSTPPGRWWMEVYHKESDAESAAEKGNEVTSLYPEVRYSVERHDELSKERAPSLRDYLRSRSELAEKGLEGTECPHCHLVILPELHGSYEMDTGAPVEWAACPACGTEIPDIL